MSLRPRVGVGLVVHRSDEVLLIRRSFSHGSGTWSTPGGHIDPGESLEECAAREALEETGVEVENIRFRAVTNDVFEDEGRHYVTIWMEADYRSGEASVTADYELTEVGWFAWNALPEPLFLPLENLLEGRCYGAPEPTPPLRRSGHGNRGMTEGGARDVEGREAARELRKNLDDGTLTIRSFRESDRGRLEALWATVFPDDPPRNAPGRMIDNKLKVQPSLLLIAEEEKPSVPQNAGSGGSAGSEGSRKLLGAVMAGFDGTRGWIHHLAVLPEHRRLGIATALVRAAEDGLRELGCPKVNLQIRAANAEVQAFYRSLGYEVEDRISMGRVL